VALKIQEFNMKKSRKSFLLWATAVVGSFTAFRFLNRKSSKETVVMLTEDGKLVTIDKNLLKSGSTKITNPELQAWVKNKPGNQ
jgi:hypothetical protein